MHTPDPTDMTRTILDNRVPFCSEIGPDGEWPLTRVRATRAMTFEIPICDPWAIENTITRLLPNGKRIHQSLVRRYVLAEGEECEIPTAAMRQVRSVHCKHAACLRKPFDCADPGHVDAHFVVGGLAPMIGVVGEVRPPPLVPSIGEHPSIPFSQRIADAIQPRQAMTPDEAALERARARRAGGAR